MAAKIDVHHAAEKYLEQIENATAQKVIVRRMGDLMSIHVTNLASIAKINTIGVQFKREFPPQKVRELIAQDAVDDHRRGSEEIASHLEPVFRHATIERTATLDLPRSRALRAEVARMQRFIFEKLLKIIPKEKMKTEEDRKRVHAQLERTQTLKTGLVIHRILTEECEPLDERFQTLIELLPRIRADFEELFLRTKTIIRGLQPKNIIASLGPADQKQATASEQTMEDIIQQQAELLRVTCIHGQLTDILYQMHQSLLD